jgi:dolichol-phosphate mannosyltransferase
VNYSIVIPLKNEKENVEPLTQEVLAVMRGLSASFEIIYVNDGSTDGTAEKLKDLKETIPEIRIITLDKNYGQSSAFDAGFRAAKGTFVITMDGDRQNDPNDIPKLIALADQHELVCGIRKKRQDSLLKKLISFFANKVRSSVCQDGIKDTGCSLKIYKKTALDRIKLYQGMHRFLPALFLFEGFAIAQVEVNHRPRGAGKSNYNLFNRSLNTVADLMAVYWMRKRTLRYKVKSE